MTLQRFQSIVLRLGNQMFVRHYLWINYPHDPQIMGIEMMGQQPDRKRRPSSCECGACPICRHRNHMREKRSKSRLGVELVELGFRFNEQSGIWEIERTEESARSVDQMSSA